MLVTDPKGKFKLSGSSFTIFFLISPVFHVSFHFPSFHFSLPLSSLPLSPPFCSSSFHLSSSVYLPFIYLFPFLIPFCYFSVWLATFLGFFTAFVTLTAVCGRQDPRDVAALVYPFISYDFLPKKKAFLIV